MDNQQVAEQIVQALLGEFQSCLLVPDGYTAELFYSKRWKDIITPFISTAITDMSSATNNLSTSEGQCAQTPREDLRAGALAEYENASTVAHSWSSVIPRAINYYFDHAAPAEVHQPTPIGDELAALDVLYKASTQGEWTECPPRWKGDTEAALIFCDPEGGSLGVCSSGSPLNFYDEAVATTKFIIAAHNAWPQLLARLVEAEANNKRMAEGEKWIAEQLMQMLVAIIPALADAAIVTNKDFHADYVLSWVRQLASTHIELRTTLAAQTAEIEALHLLALSLGLDCSNCPNRGWNARQVGEDEWEQEQCEFCYCEPRSKFNIKTRIDALPSPPQAERTT